jgi:Plasmid pRiA4b ORF-3-like protein
MIEIEAGSNLENLFPLPKGKKFFYMFDYGDSWYFRISKTKKKLMPKQKGISYPRVVEAVGKNPEQYPDYDEW